MNEGPTMWYTGRADFWDRYPSLFEGKSRDHFVHWTHSQHTQSLWHVMDHTVESGGQCHVYVNLECYGRPTPENRSLLDASTSGCMPLFFFFFYIKFNSLVCTFQWSFTLVGITEACGLSVIMITIFLYTLKHIDGHSSTSEFLSHSYIVHIHFHDYSYIYFFKHIYIYVTNLTLLIISCNTSKYIII